MIIHRKYVSTDSDKRGNIRWYFRRKGVKVRLPNGPNGKSFEIAYTEALKASESGILRPQSHRPQKDISVTIKKTGYVYFLKSGDFFKIGYSNNPIARAGGIKTAMPGNLEFMVCIPGTRHDERDLHRKFAKGRCNGEWFKIGPSFYEEMATIIGGRRNKKGHFTAPLLMSGAAPPEGYTQNV